ncbi:hypothetical protein B0H10DRAFT_869180 [Mycena sp. CBHHK59/15]|nr:hypothetical protein B0H10DRAFT_869180 [Mycena sp. CBHHK59/15]
MDDTEQDSLHADSTVLVATTIATLVLAGSAFICRSGRRLTLASALSRTDPDGSKHPLKAHAADNASDDAKDAKAARSKERRRRGKDPLKEILKGGKKLKALGIVPRDRDDIGSSTSASTSPLPRMTMMPESGSSQRSASLCTSSSRSVSASTASSALLHTTETDPAAPDSHDGDPATHGASEANSANNVSQIPETPIISISSTSPAATADKASAVQPSQTFPPYYPATGASGSWDWDGQRPSSTSDAVCRKPPRFRSKSKSRGAPVPPSVSMPFASTSASTSTSESTAHSPQQPSSLSSLSSEDLTFPTLNSAAPTAAPEASKPIVAAGGNGTPRRAPTPRRTPTPSSGSGGGNTPPPLSLAAQTQLASLRGALEAARMREEKARATSSAAPRTSR